MLFLKKISVFLFLIFIVNVHGMEKIEPPHLNVALSIPTCYYYPINESDSKILSALAKNAKGVLLPDNRLCLWLSKDKKEQATYYENNNILIINSFLKSLRIHNVLAFYVSKEIIGEQTQDMHFVLYSVLEKEKINIYLDLNNSYKGSSYTDPICFENSNDSAINFNKNRPIKDHLHVFNTNTVDHCCLFACIYDQEKVEEKKDTYSDVCYVGMCKPSINSFKQIFYIDKDNLLKKIFNQTEKEYGSTDLIFNKLYANQVTEKGFRLSSSKTTASTTSWITIDDAQITQDALSKKILFSAYLRVFFSRVIGNEEVTLPVYCLLSNNDLSKSSSDWKSWAIKFLQIETTLGFFKDPVYFDKDSDPIFSSKVLRVHYFKEPLSNDKRYITCPIVNDIQTYLQQDHNKKALREEQILSIPVLNKQNSNNHKKTEYKIPIEIDLKFTQMIGALKLSNQEPLQELVPIIDAMKAMYTELSKTLLLLTMDHNTFESQKNTRDQAVKNEITEIQSAAVNTKIDLQKQVKEIEGEIKKLSKTATEISKNINNSQSDAQKKLQTDINSAIKTLVTNFSSALSKMQTEYSIHITNLQKTVTTQLEEKIKKIQTEYQELLEKTKTDVDGRNKMLEELIVKNQQASENVEKTLQNRIEPIKKSYEASLQKIKSDTEDYNKKIKEIIEVNTNISAQLNGALKNATPLISRTEGALKDLEEFKENIRLPLQQLELQMKSLIKKLELIDTRLSNIDTTLEDITLTAAKNDQSHTKKYEELKNNFDQLDFNYKTLLDNFTELKSNYEVSQKALKKAEIDPSKEGYNWRLNFATIVGFIIVVQWLTEYAQANYGITVPYLSIAQLK